VTDNNPARAGHVAAGCPTFRAGFCRCAPQEAARGSSGDDAGRPPRRKALILRDHEDGAAHTRHW